MVPELATLGGGCFWCVEAAALALRGVERVTSGYAGGATENPTYREVCSERTGHAEVVQIEFDAEEIAYRDLLDVFFTVHDPTTRNRQGNDVGTQYRSIILTHDEAQRATAEQRIRDLEDEGIWPDPIVTEVVALERFWPAEEVHHDYYRRNPDQPYCQVVIHPKLAKLRQRFASRLRTP